MIDQILLAVKINRLSIDDALADFIPQDFSKVTFKYRHTPNNTRLQRCYICSYLIYSVIFVLLGIAVMLTYLNTSIQLILSVTQLTLSSLDGGNGTYTDQIKGVAVAQAIYAGLIILVVPYVKEYGTKISPKRLSAELYAAFSLTAKPERRVDLLVGTADHNVY